MHGVGWVGGLWFRMSFWTQMAIDATMHDVDRALQTGVDRALCRLRWMENSADWCGQNTLQTKATVERALCRLRWTEHSADWCVMSCGQIWLHHLQFHNCSHCPVCIGKTTVMPINYCFVLIMCTQAGFTWNQFMVAALLPWCQMKLTHI